MRIAINTCFVVLLAAAPALSSPVKVSIPGTINAVPAPASNLTWASAAATMTSWHSQAAASLPTVAAAAGEGYASLILGDLPIRAGDEDAFLAKVGLISEVQSKLTPMQVVRYLQCLGPLWITDTSPNPLPNMNSAPGFLERGLIITAVSGDTDPPDGSQLNITYTDATSASSQTVTYDTFLRSIGAFDLADYGNADQTLTIIHFPCNTLHAV